MLTLHARAAAVGAVEPPAAVDATALKVVAGTAEKVAVVEAEAAVALDVRLHVRELSEAVWRKAAFNKGKQGKGERWKHNRHGTVGTLASEPNGHTCTGMA